MHCFAAVDEEMVNLMEIVDEQIMFLAIRTKVNPYAVAKSLETFDENTKHVRGDYDKFVTDIAADI
jgi:hypothetical protein